jgi:hypothetical protein
MRFLTEKLKIMTHMTHMTHCYNPTRIRAHARTRDRPSGCVICVMTPPAWVGGTPRTVGHRLVGASSFRQIGGMRVPNVSTLLVSEYALWLPPRHGAEGPQIPKAPRGGSGKTETRAPAHENRFWMVDLVGTPAGANGGGYSQGLVARIRPSERQRGAEPPETASTLAGMTHSHTMQGTLPDRPASVSALTPAGERKEMTMNRATHGIVVGFAGLP